MFTVLWVSIFFFLAPRYFLRSASPFRPLVLWTVCIVAGVSSLCSCISPHNLEASSLAVLIPVTPHLVLRNFFFFVPPTRCGNFVRKLLCFADVSSFKLQCRLHVYQVFTHLLTSIASCADAVGQKSYSVLCLPPSLSPRLRRSADGHAGLYRRALRNISKWSHSCQRQQQYLNE